METGIRIEGPKGIDVEAAVAVAGAISEVLQVAGRERTPEAVQLAAMRTISEALGAKDNRSFAIRDCILGDKRNVAEESAS